MGKAVSIDKIKRLTLIAMFSDDDLMNELVYKGGNAIDLVYKLNSRASIDHDFSIQGDFAFGIDVLKSKIQRGLETTFGPEGLVPFDLSLVEKPKVVTENLIDFWGGYEAKFKLIDSKVYQAMISNPELLSKQSIRIGNRGTVKIDISKFEACSTKVEHDFEFYRIFAYSPEMIVAEKLRALCQQTREYSKIVQRSKIVGRARDFLDIHLMVTSLGLEMESDEACRVLTSIFEAKRVPISLLSVIRNYKSNQEVDFPAVVATLSPSFRLESFEFYFEFVCKLAEAIRNRVEQTAATLRCSRDLPFRE
jgi:predicted nucleotidyltransferase component of viral defense system